MLSFENTPASGIGRRCGSVVGPARTAQADVLCWLAAWLGLTLGARTGSTRHGCVRGWSVGPATRLFDPGGG
jgi:hypothetical protein